MKKSTLRQGNALTCPVPTPKWPLRPSVVFARSGPIEDDAVADVTDVCSGPANTGWEGNDHLEKHLSEKPFRLPENNGDCYANFLYPLTSDGNKFS